MKTLNAMVQAARAAEKILLDMQSQPLTHVAKGASDLVTQADLNAQKAILEELHKSCPTIPTLAEEDAQHQVPDQQFFVIDPLDNTKRYSRKVPYGWGTIIAHIEKGEPTSAVITLPAEKILITAVKGQGCFLNDTKVTLHHTDPLAKSVLGIEVGHWLDEHCMQTVVGPLAAHSSQVWSCESVCGVQVLQGYLGAWVFVRGKDKKGGGMWDFAAPALAVQEAGGWVGTLQGEPLRWNVIDMNGILFAANQGIAQEIRSLTKHW